MTWDTGTISELIWFKSSYSGDGGGNCVEVAATEVGAHIRDSKNTPGAILSVPSAAWASFLTYASASGHTGDR